MSSIAYFVSPHGFGHAARAAAVMAALRRLRPATSLHVFTTVPRWFFEDSLDGPLEYHPLRADVGLEQRDAFGADLPATVAALSDFWDAADDLATGLATTLRRLDVALVVSDISPLGLLAAERASRPGVLVENFTWDWIYDGYTDEEPRLAGFSDRNREIFARAAIRIQTEPFCQAAPGAVRVPPVSRAPRSDRAAVRRMLGLAAEDSRPLVLLTMGGLGWRSAHDPGAGGEAFFVSLGGVDQLRERPGRVELPNRSPIYPPDLVAAADLVVARVGYSTVAECFRAGARLLFVERPGFRESEVLADFCRRRLAATALERRQLESGEWLADLPALLARPAPAAAAASGGEKIARLLAAELG